MATHNGTSGVDTIIVKNKVSTPGYNVTGATPTGDFSDTSLTVNGQAGDDMIDLSGLTTASGVTSVTVNGGNGDDTIRGSDSVDLDVLLAANPTVPISIPRSGTPSPAAWNLTSVGRMDTNGDLVNDYSVWRLENGTADPLTVTLRVYGGGVVWSGTLPPLTNTFVASLSITGTHILDSTLGSRTKAPGPQVFDYDTDIGGDDILNGDSGDDTIYGNGGNDTITGGSGNDTVNGGDGKDTIQVREDDSEFDSIQGGAGTDTVKVLGNWARFDSFNASTSSIETFDASGKIVYGNASDNTLDFSALNAVLNSPAGLTGLQIEGQDGNDIVTGTKFGDLVNAGNGNDTVDGGDANDTLNGQAGDDHLYGGNGNDLLYGNSGIDTVDGGAGDDTIQVREDDSQFDSIHGGDGNDTVKVLGNWVRFNNFNAGTSSIETFDANGKNVYGNATANTLNFSALTSVEDSPLGADKGLRIFAEAGDDTVTGTTFDDVINGEAGNDTLNGGLGNDTLNGGADDDTLNGDDGDDLLYGDSGVDSVNGGKGNDTIQVREGDSEFDTILGGADNDTVKVLGNWARFNNFNAGTSSIEIVDASGKNVHGNGNANVFDFSAAQMVNVPQVNLENGDDTVTTSTNHTVVTTYDGQGGGDKINLLFTPDQLGGFSVGTITAIDNYVSAPTGKTLNSGNTIGFGFTARNFESATANVLVDGQVYNITGYLGGINNVVVATLTQTTINGTPNQDLIVGNALNNTINGLAEADLIFGLGGNDSIKGGAGADYLFGGEGDDTFLANLNEPEDDVLQGGSGIDTLQRTTDGGQGNLVLNGFSATNGIERINLDAGGSNRAIDGNANGNVLDFSATTLLSGNVNGLGGNDTITATNSATRTYDGGDGNDILNGGTQADNLIGGADIDTISGNGGNDNITGGAGADNLDGGEGNDTFYANLTEAELDVLQGGNGVDTLQRTTNGGQGNLVLNDFFADNSIEQINLDAGGSNRAIDGNANGNVLNFSATTLLSGNVFGLGGDDIITATSSAARTYDGGADNDTLIGGTQNDTLIGGSGIDSIFGYDGNDRIVGGDGADTLTGGTGADVFRFANPIEGFDTITDFVVVDDKIEISTSGFTGVGGLGTLSASRFAYAGRETASTRIIYALGTGAVSYDADGSGIGAAVKFAQLNTGLALTNTNFSIGF